MLSYVIFVKPALVSADFLSFTSEIQTIRLVKYASYISIKPLFTGLLWGTWRILY